jgi:eukaryotic-like serine/threonine-protein kinase
MAEIYRARTRSTPDEPSRWVAIKMMRPALGHEDLREQLFKREARIASMISHPNVVPLFEFGLEMERHYISMEYVRGRDLSHLLKDDKRGAERLPFELGLYIGYQAASGLGYAHRLRDEPGESLGIVHRDISPGNVMVGYDGQVKVLDFGVARMNDSEGMRTQTGTLRGKFAYMSPEQTLGEPLDARSDVFSLGTVLYELLTGSNCFRADNPIATLDRVQRVRPVPPSRANKSVPQAIDRILARCLAKDKKRRFPDCAALEESLGEFLDKWGWTGREGLARHMRERFSWESGEEEKELKREEEEVALLEVVDFALVGEDVGLDAANLAVSQEEEASHSEIKKVGDRVTGDEGENVFEGDAEPPPVGALEEGSDPNAATDLEMTVAHSRPGARALGPPAAERHASVKPKRFVDDEEMSGQSVELASILQAKPSPASPPPSAPERRASVPRAASAQDKGGPLGLLLVGRRAPEFPSTGVREAPPDPEDPLESRSTTPQAMTSSGRLARKRLLARPTLVIAVLGAAVLLVASLVTMGIESQSGPPGSAALATPKRTKIAPVTITIDDAKKKQEAAPPITEEKTDAIKTVAATDPGDEPAAVEAAAGDEEPPPGDADDEIGSSAKDGARSGSPRKLRSPRTRASSAKPHEKKTEAPKPPVEKPEKQDKPERAEKSKKEKGVAAAPVSGKQTGFLNVGAKPWAEISIDSQKWPYQTPQAGIELPVGRHTVTLSNRETGVTRSQIVQITQGTYKTISMDMTKK